MSKKYRNKILASVVILLFIVGVFLPITHSQASRLHAKRCSGSPHNDGVPRTTGVFDGSGSDSCVHYTGKDNHPPHPPILSGPASGRVDIEYTWSILSVDPDDDTVTYYVDWGDQCGAPDLYGPFPSGAAIEISHTYHFKSTFIINARAIDAYGAESNTTYFEVIMPKTTILSAPLLLRFLERFPYTFPLFRHLLGYEDGLLFPFFTV